ncbi:Gamma-aminobutyric acid type B receptor subunit 2, partial [Rhizoclosmatium hyalinum]
MCGDLQASPALSNKNEFPYYFRIYSGLGIHKHIYLLLKAWGVRRVAILVGNDQFNRQTAADMIQLLGVNGIKILQVVHVGPLFQKSTLNALKIVDARYILTFVATASLSNMYFHCKDLIGPKYVWIGVDNPSSSNPTDLEQQLLQGFILVTPKNVGNRTLLNDRFAPGSELDFSAPVGAFDCINTLLYGIASLLQSDASFTPKKLATRKLQKYLKPALFSNTNYHGAYQDPIILDPITGDLIIPYSFLDFVNSEAIGFTDSNATQIYFTNYRFKFHGGSTIPPPDGPPILSAAIEIDSYEGFLLILLIVSGLALSVTCATLLAVFRLNKIFVKSAPIFSGLIVVGSFLAYASIGLLLGKPTAIICHLRLWFQAIGFSVAITAFLVKNYRIHMIFSSRTIIPKSKLSNERFGGFLVNFILIEI